MQTVTNGTTESAAADVSVSYKTFIAATRNAWQRWIVRALYVMLTIVVVAHVLTDGPFTSVIGGVLAVEIVIGKWLLVYIVAVVPLHELLHFAVARARGGRPRFAIVKVPGLFGWRFWNPAVKLDGEPVGVLLGAVLAPQTLSVLFIVLGIALYHAYSTAACGALILAAANLVGSDHDVRLSVFAARYKHHVRLHIGEPAAP